MEKWMRRKGLVPLSLRDTINPLEVDGGTMLIPREKKEKKEGRKEKGKERRKGKRGPLVPFVATYAGENAES